MAKVERFEDLRVWQEAIDIGVKIYELADSEPLSRDFKARDQLIGAAVSISNNIAERFEYNNNKVFKKFLHYSKGSAGEVRSQLALLEKVGRVNKEDAENIRNALIVLSSKIKAFINYLNNYN